jgi:hypothetical protein
MARILWLPPSLFPGSTRSFTPKCVGHSVPTGVRGAPATTLGPFAPEALPSLLRTHARVLWPPCRFDLGLIGTGLRRLCHPRLVHRTVLALAVWLLPKVSCPLATGARLVHTVDFFPSDCGLHQQEMARRAPSPPANDFTRAPIFDAAGILFDYDPFVHSPPWSLPRSYTRRGLCRSSLLGIRFLFPSRASYPDESTDFRDRICTC